MNKSEITIENLTNQLCTFEKALESRTADLGPEALTTSSRKVPDKLIGEEAKHVTGTAVGSEGSQLEKSVGAVKGLMTATASLVSDNDNHGWYVANWAMNHDDFSRFRLVYYMKQKSEVPEKLRQFLKETQVIGHVIKEFLNDNRGEFDSCAVREILRENGIKQRLTMLYTLEQNGCSEKENRTLV
ncbi:hypothetical protein PR048_023570 [Dryococelus australis]|uniref:Integrase catalytic domain-containing protein n=1 Tax=Dryococelus australis TaxID=614101 RepID=A0ABQ9GUG3_9NEOP|nr:hypothetical protein PR048_023570 [Dryococelus australis]